LQAVGADVSSAQAYACVSEIVTGLLREEQGRHEALCNLANEVLKGATEKAKRGGTPGRAPLGYLNIREPQAGGGEVRTVVIDPDRGRIITWAFDTYATGLYSLTDMTLLLEARGLRSRGDRRYGSRPLNLSTVHDLLSNPYYIGIVSYRRKQYSGRHEPLVSQETFDKVQAVLQAHGHAGERDRKHLHYLKGSIRCGVCGSGLAYSRNKGNGGQYEYFVCPKNQRGECAQGYQPVDLVEAAIEQHYATVGVSDAERDQVRERSRRTSASAYPPPDRRSNAAKASLTLRRPHQRRAIRR
jgi:hypothetical protein